MGQAERNGGEEIKREIHRLTFKYLSTSEFNRLMDEFANANRGARKEIHGLEFEAWKEEFGENKVYISLVWDKTVLEDGTVETKHVEIEFKPNGTIVVEGGIRGSLTLLLSSWEDRPDIQRQALKKAIQHPIILRTLPTLQR